MPDNHGVVFHRICAPDLTESFFLFGARGTGKTTLLREILKAEDCLWIDLLRARDEDIYSRDPEILIQQILKQNPDWVVVDEVQKLPKLLDIIHFVIESPTRAKFALTGSSARKLKLGAADLLAGRAFLNILSPITFLEAGKEFCLNTALGFGTLPKVFQLKSDTSRASYLRSYAQTYLKEEIWSEQIVRRLEPFRRFLAVAAQMNGKLINQAKIAQDVGVDPKTVSQYFQILEDTHLGFMLEGFDHSLRKRLGKTPKFFFFDIGVARALAGHLRIQVVESTSQFGELFEQLVVLEMYRLNHYFALDLEFSHLRTKDNAEIDLVIKRPGKSTVLCEIKSTRHVDSSDLNFMRTIASDLGEPAVCYCLCREERSRLLKDVHVMPWMEGIREIVGA